MAKPSSPLTVAVAPDPKVMERAISRLKLQSAEQPAAGGNGNGNGNGGNGDSLLLAPPPTAPAQNAGASTPPAAGASNPAEPTPTSVLGTVLKGVSRSQAPFGQAASSESVKLISFEQEKQSNMRNSSPEAIAPESIAPESIAPAAAMQAPFPATLASIDPFASNQSMFAPPAVPSDGKQAAANDPPLPEALPAASHSRLGQYPADPPFAGAPVPYSQPGEEPAAPGNGLPGAQSLPPAAHTQLGQPPAAASDNQGPIAPPVEATSGPLVPPAAVASAVAPASGPVYSARVPIPFLPRPSSSFMRNQVTPLDQVISASGTPPGSAAFAAQPAAQTVPAPDMDPFAPPGAASSFNSLPGGLSSPSDPLYAPSTSIIGGSNQASDPTFAPAASAGATAAGGNQLFPSAANPIQPVASAQPASDTTSQPLSNDPFFNPGQPATPSYSFEAANRPGVLPPDPRQTDMFGMPINSAQPAAPVSTGMGSPPNTADAILPPMFPFESVPQAAGGNLPFQSSATPTQSQARNTNAQIFPSAQPSSASSASGIPSGFDFFAAPTYAPAQNSPDTQPVAPATSSASPATPAMPGGQLPPNISSPMDLFQGQVVAHPAGQPVIPNTQPSNPASFDPVPASASGVTSGLDFFTDSPAVAPSANPATPATFTPSQPATTRPPSASVSAEFPAAGREPTGGADFFSGQPSATAGDTRPDAADSKAKEDAEGAAGRAGDVDVKSGSSLRDRQASESEMPKPKGLADQIIEFGKDIDGECNFLGRMMPKKQVLVCCGVLAFIGVLLLFRVAGFAGGVLSGAFAGIQQQMSNQAANQYPSLAGTWELAYQAATEQKVHPGTMQIMQSGSNLQGEGQDEAYFQLRGIFTPPKIMLNKQYVVNGASKGRPIKYIGEVTFSKSEPPVIDGIFIAEIKRGVFTSAHYEELRGKWQAQMVVDAKGQKLAINNQQPGVATGPQPSAQPEEQPAGGDSGSSPGSFDFQGLFSKLLIGMLLLGVGVVFASLKLFGPAGLINIWSKQEYIPSQFKSQHKKMLKELGKPLKPGGLPLGEREDWNVMKIGEPKELHLPPELRDRNPHLLIMGSGAKGKSRLIANMVSNDILSGDRAVVVIDSDGHLVDLILRWMASHPKGKDFAKRVLVIDPTNKDGCAAYNPLEPPEDDDYQAAASAIVYGFKAIYTEPPGSQTQWNQQTANILRNAALLLMANGKTLTDLPVLLSDNDFRDLLLEKIEKRRNERIEFITLIDQWANYKKLARTDQWINWTEPILNRVTPMLGDPRIRPILTPAQSDLSLRQIIAQHQVLLVKIPQGQLDQNASLLGSLLLTGLKQAAMSIATSSTKRHFTALYLDEFDNFIEKETFDAITSDTRKFQIGFTAAIKTVQHLPEDFRNQLIINVGTLCAFSLAKKDADMLGPQMFRVDGRKVKHQTITNIFNKVNSSPQFELISDEEKLNIDRLVGLEERSYFCYRVGSIAGVFLMKAHEFKDVSDKEVNWALIDQIYGNKKSAMESVFKTAS